MFKNLEKIPSNNDENTSEDNGSSAPFSALPNLSALLTAFV